MIGSMSEDTAANSSAVRSSISRFTVGEVPTLRDSRRLDRRLAHVVDEDMRLLDLLRGARQRPSSRNPGCRPPSGRSSAPDGRRRRRGRSRRDSTGPSGSRPTSAPARTAPRRDTRAARSASPRRACRTPCRMPSSVSSALVPPKKVLAVTSSRKELETSASRPSLSAFAGSQRAAQESGASG